MLNVDVKIYAKILANRLLPFLTTWVHLDQVGFILGREAQDNTTKTLNVLHWMSSKRQSSFFLFLDTTQAFDRVAWDYLSETLVHLGIPSIMVDRIIAL